MQNSNLEYFLDRLNKLKLKADQFDFDKELVYSNDVEDLVKEIFSGESFKLVDNLNNAMTEYTKTLSELENLLDEVKKL